MKRLLFIFLFFLFSYSTYYDLTVGTLPTKATTATVTNEQNTRNVSGSVKDQPYLEVEIKPGDTVLSVVEHIHEGPIKASIKQIIYDFQILNPNTNPEEIIIGEHYLFPVYNH